MHVKRFLHKMLGNVIHLKRLDALKLLVSAAIKTKKVSVTQLGRGIEGKIQERSGIRKSDRLVGNKHLHAERQSIYETVIKRLVNNKTRPRIIVDWSAIPNTKYHVLRAALVAKGRALTLYEAVYPEKKLGKEKVQNKFLIKLKELLPTGCNPIIMTDAGFHTPWFQQVLNLGWDYVGRIRGTYKYSQDDKRSWQTCKSLLKKATFTEKSMGKVLLSQKSALPSHLYLFKEKLKGRKSKTRAGKKKKDSQTKDYSRSAREPWLLASSLGGTSYLHAKRVVKLYKTRMQIEEAFRDLKSSRYGLSFEQAFSNGIVRIENLLLIAMLASLIAWLVGWLGEKKQLHLQFQVNSIKHRRVLSLFFLGCQLIIKKITINIEELFAYINRGFLYD